MAPNPLKKRQEATPITISFFQKKKSPVGG
jgi:hypothetical protein